MYRAQRPNWRYIGLRGLSRLLPTCIPLLDHTYEKYIELGMFWKWVSNSKLCALCFGLLLTVGIFNVARINRCIRFLPDRRWLEVNRACRSLRKGNRLIIKPLDLLGNVGWECLCNDSYWKYKAESYSKESNCFKSNGDIHESLLA